MGLLFSTESVNNGSIFFREVRDQLRERGANQGKPPRPPYKEQNFEGCASRGELEASGLNPSMCFKGTEVERKWLEGSKRREHLQWRRPSGEAGGEAEKASKGVTSGLEREHLHGEEGATLKGDGSKEGFEIEIYASSVGIYPISTEIYALVLPFAATNPKGLVLYSGERQQNLNA